MNGSPVESVLRRDRVLLLGAVGVLFLLAVLYTVFGVGMEMSALEMTAMRGMRDMPGTRAPGDWGVGYAALVFLMWWVMMVAMMLPSAAPVVLLNAALVRHTREKAQASRLSTVFLAGYLLAWAGFGAATTALQWGLEAAGLVSATMMTLIATTPGALVLIAAGAWQLTPAKAACLRHCRAPAAWLAEHRRPGAAGALRMGLVHGTWCLGCCWALMALLFAGGIMNLYWIAGLAAVVALEKLSPFGEALGRLAGAGLILWGAIVLAGAL